MRDEQLPGAWEWKRGMNTWTGMGGGGFRQVKLFCRTPQRWVHIITQLSKLVGQLVRTGGIAPLEERETLGLIPSMANKKKQNQTNNLLPFALMSCVALPLWSLLEIILRCSEQ